jgi:hypothetical protein
MVFFFSPTTLETRKNLPRDFPPFCVESLLSSTGGQYSTLFGTSSFAKKGKKDKPNQPYLHQKYFL